MTKIYWGDRIPRVNDTKIMNEDGSITFSTIEGDTSGTTRWQGIVSYVDMAEEGVTSWSVSTTVKLPAGLAAGMNSGIWIDCDPTEITRTDAIIAAVYDETAEGLVWKVYDEEPNNGEDWVDIEGQTALDPEGEYVLTISFDGKVFTYYVDGQELATVNADAGIDNTVIEKIALENQNYGTIYSSTWTVPEVTYTTE